MEEPSETLRSALPTYLDAQWIVGFVDGEGCFYVGINKHSYMTCGYQVLPEFTVVQHKRDIQILHILKKFFGCGVVRSNHDDRMAYRVRDIDHFKKIIIPFFERYSLRTKKKIDFLKFRKIIMLIDRKEHLTMQGIKEIETIAASMNRGNEDKVQPY